MSAVGNLNVCFSILIHALFASHPGAAAPVKPAGPGGTPPEVSVTLSPVKPMMDEADPLTFHLKVTNGSKFPLQYLVASVAMDGSTSRPVTISTVLENVDTRTTQALFPRLFEPVGNTTGVRPLTTYPEYVHVMPRDSFTTTFMLESTKHRTSVLNPVNPGKYRLQAEITDSSFQAFFSMLPSRRDLSKPVYSGFAEFSIRKVSAANKRVYHDRLGGWWEWMTLTLMSDGRFVLTSFSDDGGKRPPVKGTYVETADALTLDALVNADLGELEGKLEWKKVEVGPYQVLMTSLAAENYLEDTFPSFYPVLCPTTEEAATTGTFTRPWDTHKIQ